MFRRLMVSTLLGLCALGTSLVALIGGCRRQMTVEAKDVKFSLIKPVGSGADAKLKIHGLVFHSSLAVQRIDQHRIGDAVVIDVVLTPARRGLSGSFDVEIPLTGVTRVLFGPSQFQIWPENSSVDANKA